MYLHLPLVSISLVYCGGKDPIIDVPLIVHHTHLVCHHFFIFCFNNPLFYLMTVSLGVIVHISSLFLAFYTSAVLALIPPLLEQFHEDCLCCALFMLLPSLPLAFMNFFLDFHVLFCWSFACCLFLML